MNIFLYRLGCDDSGLLMDAPISAEVADDATVEDALRLMHVSEPAIDQYLTQKYVSIFGVIVKPGQLLCPGDRIELLDDLRFDAMQSRRRRALHTPKHSRRSDINPSIPKPSIENDTSSD